MGQASKIIYFPADFVCEDLRGRPKPIASQIFRQLAGLAAHLTGKLDFHEKENPTTVAIKGDLAAIFMAAEAVEKALPPDTRNGGFAAAYSRAMERFEKKWAKEEIEDLEDEEGDK